ncbi:hypothetical protein EVAR_90482_1 [Eumeta japonica]|uniref:RNase H type-1 domain-containing protein n=1 Tax=Eumeta variegata TaxID=151549 RepID=A0A4C2ADM2_EUMVA|nr:hypothetical protein EVAR_90482_1 [Eumeta japonica]
MPVQPSGISFWTPTPELGELGVYVQAFADDGPHVLRAVGCRSRRPIRAQHCWGVRNKLRFAPSKTNSMGLARAAKATWGLSPEIVRTIYITVSSQPCCTHRALGTGEGSSACARCSTLSSAASLLSVPGSPHSVPAFRADPLEAAPLDIRELETLYWRLASPCARARDRVRERRDLDSQTVDRLAVVGPQIYTDGSRIEGKVGAALTEWRDGEETWYSTRGSIPSARSSRLRWSRCKERYGGEEWRRAGQHLQRLQVFFGGRAVRLFWVRAHAGIAGNERADELARRAALTKRRQRTMDFRCRTLKGDQGGEPGRQQRYAEEALTLTGHGGFAQYLFRFKLRDSLLRLRPRQNSGCAARSRDCDMFLRERALEAEIGVAVSRRHFRRFWMTPGKEKFFKLYSLTERCNKINKAT